MPHVSERLAQFLADLEERITLKKMQAQRLALIRRQGIHDFIETITAKNGFSGIIVLRGRFSDPFNTTPRKERLCVELPGLQVTPPIECPVIGHLHNPGSSGALGAIEDSAPSLDIEKQVLDQVFRFGCVS